MVVWHLKQTCGALPLYTPLMLPQFRGWGLTPPERWHCTQTSPSGWQAWHDCKFLRASVEWSMLQDAEGKLDP